MFWCKYGAELSELAIQYLPGLRQNYQQTSLLRRALGLFNAVCEDPRRLSAP
jgi:hypothetical protein